MGKTRKRKFTVDEDGYKCCYFRGYGGQRKEDVD